MKISKVKFNEEGKAGFESVYTMIERRGQNDARVEHSSKWKYPVQQELRDLIESLRVPAQHLLELDENMSIHDIKVQGVSIKDKGFVITVSYKTTYDCWITTNTPFIDDTKQTSQYDIVQEVLVKLVEEVEAYILKKKEASTKQIALQFGEEANIDKSAIENMTEKEQEDFVQEYLTKKNAIMVTLEEVLDENAVDENPENKKKKKAKVVKLDAVVESEAKEESDEGFGKDEATGS